MWLVSADKKIGDAPDPFGRHYSINLALYLVPNRLRVTMLPVIAAKVPILEATDRQELENFGSSHY